MLNKSFKEIADRLMREGINPVLQFTEMQVGTAEKFTAIVLTDVDENLRYFRIMPDGMVAPIISISRQVQHWPGHQKSELTPPEEDDIVDTHIKLPGYVPGEDNIICKDCKNPYTGDKKKSVRCVVCATDKAFKSKGE